ncbi:hypothetical protein P152DRAFT_481226 [Eremomyces bilateralis CBS 781.70]|uniref:Amino acid transporter n=1 Tax=Eremomyces bilateralis CBS 781.70 TaxID=1392243 RepID=A0A6G1G7Q4_9PEZI|nr:uncharacterized protein P152DRAFT_481226 [Eremomyces bilateralis CBS 781.70]KAF1814073.1 hypothetical protein P152DRAFT_481226 [Eremomyces bilateralis CBS 781.70]
MAAFDQVEFEDVLRDLDEGHQRVDRAPSTSELLGPFSIICLFLNRTIGSGIFMLPGKVLAGTGSVGASLLLWAFGALIHLCGLLVWLELGLSVPFRNVPGTNEQKSVPRSGGELNYLQFIFYRSKLLTACMYGIPYIIVGSLAGNSIAIGKFVMEAAGHEKPSRGPIIGIALVALTAAVLVHVCSRRGGILVNNTFAILKVLLLVVIIIFGFIKAGGKRFGGQPPATDNFDLDKSFSGPKRTVVHYVDALMCVLYPYSGFQQPFYVLSEVRHPRKIFPKSTILALCIGATLFMLVNIAYFLAVPKEVQLKNPSIPMASLFFQHMFGDHRAKQAMSGLAAFSIFGNIVVMTFTASRVKQEIAKEGVLPFSLFFATSMTTPWAWFKAKWSRRPASDSEDERLEQTPMAALGLHWAMSVLLVGVTAMLPPETSYAVLVDLYSYTIRVLAPLIVSGGLLYLKFKPSVQWSSRANFIPWLSPTHVVVYFLTLGFLAIASFAKPPAESPSALTESLSASVAVPVKWFIVPTVGISALTWGLIWFLGLKVVMWSVGRELNVTRTPIIVPDIDSQWVQKAELIEHEWHTRSHRRTKPASPCEDGIEMASSSSVSI